LIFVVDDEPLMLDYAALALEKEPCELHVFGDPIPALRAMEIAPQKPDLLITDFAMHSMTGMEFARRSRTLVPGLPIVMVSGTVDETVLAECPGLVDRFLRKPYASEALAQAVRSVVSAVAPQSCHKAGSAGR
jgi:CheY-like chemotaxis protein